MRMFKGFNRDMTCNGFKYEEGKTYEEPVADLCHCGFHACEDPLDCFSYYDPAHSVFHEVEMEDVSPETSDDTKRVARRITIGAEVSLPMLGKLHARFVQEKVTESVKHGDSEAVSVGNNKGALTGDSGSSVSGVRGSSVSGDSGSSVSGDSGSSVSGDRGSSVSGFSGSSVSGDSGSSVSGFRGSSVSGGKSETGKNGISLARGNGCAVKGKLGALLVVAEEKETSYDIASYATGIVDGETIKEDTWYKCVNGQLVEAEPTE